MDQFFKISIPEPCHEDWKKMTPKDKGRFCNSCVKTVVDFTKMHDFEIQDFITQNKGNKLCGHFKKSQLDSINIHIPIQSLSSRNFHKTFLLALLITMGTSLMSCTNKKGEQQKIDSVEVIDSKNDTIVDIIGGLSKEVKIDTLINKSKQCSTNQNSSNKIAEKILVDGEIELITTTGTFIQKTTTLGIPKIEEISPTEKQRDSLLLKELEDLETVEIEGEMILGDIGLENEDTIFGIYNVETLPKFPDTPQHLSKQEKKDYFSNTMSSFIKKNIEVPQGDLGLTGKQRIYTNFTIDKEGKLKNIKLRSPHPSLEKMIMDALYKLPIFIPAKHNNRNVEFTYTLPVTMIIED